MERTEKHSHFFVGDHMAPAQSAKAPVPQILRETPDDLQLQTCRRLLIPLSPLFLLILPPRSWTIQRLCNDRRSSSTPRPPAFFCETEGSA